MDCPTAGLSTIKRPPESVYMVNRTKYASFLQRVLLSDRGMPGLLNVTHVVVAGILFDSVVSCCADYLVTGGKPTKMST